VDPVPDPLLLRKCGTVENRTRDLWVCSQEQKPQRRPQLSLIKLKYINQFRGATSDSRSSGQKVIPTFFETGFAAMERYPEPAEYS
jgi:hypothetical protein